MQDASPSTSTTEPDTPTHSNVRLWIAIVIIALIVGLLVAGKFGGFFDPEDLGHQLGEAVRAFADGPWGVPVLIVTFCVCAYIAVPQFILIGVAVYAFGAVPGAVHSWTATMASGVLTYWVGRASGPAVLARISSRRLDRFRGFVERNAFVASAVVRNITAGPFVFVNSVFGALRVNFWAYMGGMGLGVLPKIALIALAGKGLRAALDGNEWLAAGMALIALLIFAGGWLYVRNRRKQGKNIALSGEEPVDSAK